MESNEMESNGMESCVANDTPLQYNPTKYARHRTRHRYDVSNIPSLVSYN